MLFPKHQHFSILKGKTRESLGNFILNGEGFQGISFCPPTSRLPQLRQRLHSIGFTGPPPIQPVNSMPGDGKQPPDGRLVSPESSGISPGRQECVLQRIFR